MTQVDLNACAYLAYRTADAARNRTYRQLMERLQSDKAKAMLRDAERTWIAYRDKECAFETWNSEDGTIHPMLVNQCLAVKTKAHTRELRYQLYCPERSLDCVGPSPRPPQ